MRIVIALGGNALLRRGEPMTAENQRANIRVAATAIASIAGGHEIIVTHGNGPQVGLLALQAAAYAQVPPYPLDVLGAESEGMIGYVLEQELAGLLPAGRAIATLLTQVEVAADDPAFAAPTKPIGPVYDQAQAAALAREKRWAFAPDGGGVRRVVASPKPKRIMEMRPIEGLLEMGCLVICAGGGGIPVRIDDDGRRVGVEAVIDKDYCSALLARELKADRFIIATDVGAVYVDWQTPSQRAIVAASPDALREVDLPAGSMGPKVQAACDFVEATGNAAVIGALADIGAILEGGAGTLVQAGETGLRYDA